MNRYPRAIERPVLVHEFWSLILLMADRRLSDGWMGGYRPDMKTLSMTEASKSFAKCVREVYAQHETFAIVRLGVPHALLVPPSPRSCDSHELADDLSDAVLSAADRHAIGTAVRRGRRGLKSLKNPWA